MFYFSLFRNGIYIVPQITTGVFRWPWQIIFQVRWLIFDCGIRCYLKKLSNQSALYCNDDDTEIKVKCIPYKEKRK